MQQQSSGVLRPPTDPSGLHGFTCYILDFSQIEKEGAEGTLCLCNFCFILLFYQLTQQYKIDELNSKVKAAVNLYNRLGLCKAEITALGCK